MTVERIGRCGSPQWYTVVAGTHCVDSIELLLEVLARTCVSGVCREPGHASRKRVQFQSHLVGQPTTHDDVRTDLSSRLLSPSQYERKKDASDA